MANPRGTTLTVLAVLFGTLALSNFLKAAPITEDTGFVLFGNRLAGTANVLAGIFAGAVVGSYAVGIWQMRRWAVPLAWGYALYVVLNIVLFRMRHPMPESGSGQVFELVYAVVAIGVSTGTALLLTRRRDELS